MTTEDNEARQVVAAHLLKDYRTFGGTYLSSENFTDEAQRILNALAAEGYSVVKTASLDPVVRFAQACDALPEEEDLDWTGVIAEDEDALGGSAQ